MASTVEIKIYCSTAPVRIAVSMVPKMLKIGVPEPICFHLFRAFAWGRFSTGTEWPWQGWIWFGRNMKFERNG